MKEEKISLYRVLPIFGIVISAVASAGMLCYVNELEIDQIICVAFLVDPLPIVEKDNGVKPPIKTILTYYRIKIGVPEFIYNATKNLAGQDMSVTKTMTNAPVLVNGVTYVPFDYLKEINIKHLFVNLAFTIKDNNGNILYELPYIYSEEVQFKSDLN